MMGDGLWIKGLRYHHSPLKGTSGIVAEEKRNTIFI